MGRMPMELENAWGHRVSVEQVMDYTTPRISIKLLLIVDLDSYGEFCGRWQSVRVSTDFTKLSSGLLGERRRT